MLRQLLLLAVLITASPLKGQYIPEPDLIRKHIRYLASDKMKGRGTGSRQNLKASKYIARHFRKYGLKPLGTDGFYQHFQARVRRVVVPDSIRPARNVIGFLDNNAPLTIVIGAHYDHLGQGRQGSSKSPSPEGHIHNGADDNASGTAGLLELARHFTQNKRKEEYNLLFIGFGAEELGLVGSRHFVNNPTLPLEKISFMLNMDMIGRYAPERGVAVIGYGSGDLFPQIFKGVSSEKVKFYTGDDGSGGSDNAAFFAKGIPVLFFHTGGHPDYHMPTDDADKIDLPALAGVLDLEVQALESAMKLPKVRFIPLPPKK